MWTGGRYSSLERTPDQLTFVRICLRCSPSLLGFTSLGQSNPVIGATAIDLTYLVFVKVLNPISATSLIISQRFNWSTRLDCRCDWVNNVGLDYSINNCSLSAKCYFSTSCLPLTLFYVYWRSVVSVTQRILYNMLGQKLWFNMILIKSIITW